MFVSLQCHREGDKWAWPDDQSTVDFQIHQSKADSETAVALVIDLSAEIIDQRIENTLGKMYHLSSDYSGAKSRVCQESSDSR